MHFAPLWIAPCVPALNGVWLRSRHRVASKGTAKEQGCHGCRPWYLQRPGMQVRAPGPQVGKSTKETNGFQSCPLNLSSANCN
jgi:hypothetical protein